MYRKLIDLQHEHAYLTALSIQAAGLAENEADTASVIERLELAAAGLPEDPDLAARDLDAAWIAIDQTLADLLGIEAVQPPDSTDEPPTDEEELEGTEAALGTLEAIETPELAAPESTATPED